MNHNAKTTDLTEGNPLGLLIRFTIPLLLGNLFQQFYNVVDSLVVGNFVGANALASVGACGSLGFFFFSLSSGLAIGLGVIAAQAFGAKDDMRIRKIIASSLFILVCAGAIVSSVGVFFAPQILQALRTPDAIIEDSIIYFRVTSAGIIAVALYNGISAILRALGDSKTPLYFLILSSIINIILDLLFVLSYSMGVFGVALATIISQYVSFIVSLIYALRKVSCFRLSREELRPDFPFILQGLRLAIPMALQNSVIAISSMALQSVVNSFGELIVASYTVVMRIEQLIHMPYTSLGTALTSYAGQNIGAGKIDRVQKGMRIGTLVVLGISLFFLPVNFFLGKYLVGFFVRESDVIAIGSRGLQINSLCYFGLGMIYVPRAILNGCGDSKFAMINGVTEVVCRIIYSQIFTRIPFIGFWGIWMTTGLTWITTALVCVHRYMKGKWRSFAA